MEVLGEVIGSSSDHLNIVKGKRTKRQRALSPLPNHPPFNMIITTTSSSSAAAAAAAARDDQNDHDNHNDYNDQNDQNDPNDHTTSVELYESTEEEEDMANCLILLAQGHSLNMGQRYGTTAVGGGGGARGGDGCAVTEKFISRRFTEAATTTTGKAGFYVYECKTCNRCFPSFQALGGHRASHKKPKVNHEEKKALMLLDDDNAQFNTNGPSLSLQMSNRAMFTNTTNNHNKSKVHECSICGSEFSSGQALGGHMRRHRTTNTATTMTATTTITTATTTARDTILPDTSSQQTQKTKNVLSLDLNLPAPEDDRDGKFPFNSKQQSLIFSANSLVDCHY